MNSKKGLLILAVPLAGVVLLALAASLHRAPAPLEARLAPAPKKKVDRSPAPAAAPKLAQPEAISAAVSEGTVRGMVANYRAAVATGNEILAKALRPALLRDRASALRFANEDLSRAITPNDREISRQVIDALRDQP